VLRLPKHHEHKFWQSPTVIKYFVVMDTIGLLLGVFSHYIGMRQCKRPVPLAFLALAAALQICQLAWLCTARESYMRRRQTLQIIQRARWLLVVLCLNVYISCNRASDCPCVAVSDNLVIWWWNRQVSRQVWAGVVIWNYIT
jgi:hypothetical protein